MGGRTDEGETPKQPWHPDKQAARERLICLKEDLDFSEMWMERPNQRLPGLGRSWQSFSENKSAFDGAVGVCRQAGMSWEEIGEALLMSEEEATEKFGHVDRS